MKKPVVLAVVILLVLVGVPLLMPGMGSPACANCGPALLAGSACLVAVLVGAALVAAAASLFLPRRRQRLRLRGRMRLLERPPQLATAF